MSNLLPRAWIPILVLIGISVATPCIAEVKIDVGANRNHLYLRESLIMTVTVSGLPRSPEPDVSAIKNAEVKLLGSRSESRFSTTWVNGKRQRTGFSGRIFTYSVTPKLTGRLLLGPVSIKLGSKQFTSNGPRVTVTGIEDQDDVIIKVTASRSTVLVDESFGITLDVLIRCLPTHITTECIPGNAPPHISIPYLAPNSLGGLEHTDTRALLQSMIMSRQSAPSFTINNYSVRKDPFDFEGMVNFNDARRNTPARFSLPVSKTEINGAPFWRYRIQTQYIAREERTHTFGPIVFKGSIIDSIDDANAVKTRNIFAVGASQTVRVVPPPEEGRPTSFIGAIGTNMLVDASLDTQNCLVGDPLTLKIKVSGGVNLKNIYPPDLSLQPDLLKQFRIYSDTLAVQRNDGSISFTHTVRPTESGSLELPPINLSYFDSTSRKYRTVKTAPIPVTAAQVGGVEPSMILGSSTNGIAATGTQPGSSLRYVAPFITNKDAARNQDIGLNLLHILCIAGAPVLFLLSLAVRPTMDIRRRIDRTTTNKRTYSKTLRMLKRAAATGSSSEIANALRTYVGSRFGARPDSLTPPEIAQLIQKSGLSSEYARDLGEIAQRHFNASFANAESQAHSIDDDSKRAAEIICELESTEKKRSTPTLPLLILAISLSATCSLAQADLDSETDFLWQKAWTRTLSATTQADFTRAADDYRELIASGVRNKYVFYNLGTALLLSGEDNEALLALERSERYGGMDARILQNIQIAMSDETDDPPTTSWLRIVFFWHYLLPLVWRINAATIGWIALFALMMFARLTGRKLHRPLLAIVLLGFVAFASSALTSALQENQARIRDSYASPQSDKLGGEQ